MAKYTPELIEERIRDVLRIRCYGKVGTSCTGLIFSCRISIDTRQATDENGTVIVSFKHRGLKALYEGRTARHVPPGHVDKLNRILTALDEAEGPEQMALPGFRFHRLRGGLEGHYSVWVSANWRVTFRFEGIHATDVDYLDYH